MSIFYLKCRDDLKTKLDQVEVFRDSILTVFSESDFKNKSKMLKTPFAGIMYGGMNATSGDLRAGLAADLNLGILVGLASMNPTGELENQSWTILSAIRRAILNQRSPTGHVWKFKSEVYMGDNGQISYFLQTWSTWTPIVGETG